MKPWDYFSRWVEEKRGITLHPCSLRSEPAALRHTPHSWLSDTSAEVINTKEAHGGSNIRGTKNYTTKHQLHNSASAARGAERWRGVRWDIGNILLMVSLGIGSLIKQLTHILVMDALIWYWTCWSGLKCLTRHWDNNKIFHSTTSLVGKTYFPVVRITSSYTKFWFTQTLLCTWHQRRKTVTGSSLTLRTNKATRRCVLIRDVV